MSAQPDPTEALRRIDRALALCRSVEESNRYSHAPEREPSIPIEMIRRALLNPSGWSLDEPSPYASNPGHQQEQMP
jgi:hypothetical protein